MCRRCGAHSATFPNSHLGVSRRVLGEVMNLFDRYSNDLEVEGWEEAGEVEVEVYGY